MVETVTIPDYYKTSLLALWFERMREAADKLGGVIHENVNPGESYILVGDRAYFQGEDVILCDREEFNRPSWDAYFLSMAKTASERADCRRRRVGVIVTQDNRIVGHGYNGTAPGAPGCLEGACPRGLKSYDEKPPLSDYSDCIANHAERNALWNVPAGERTGSTVYITSEPCAGCQTFMRSVGVRRVVWGDPGDLLGRAQMNL